MNGGANPHCIGFAINHPELDLAVSIAATTHLDSHGERVELKTLETFQDSFKEKFYPLLFNHDESIPPIGVILSAKLFRMADGETALATLMVFDTKPQARQFVANEPNRHFDIYQPLIDTDLLQKKHDQKMESFTIADINPEQALAAYLHSHIPQPDGRLRVNKHFIAQVSDLRIVVYPKDHRPAHFHVVSKQRNIDARFRVDTLEFLSTKKGKVTKSDQRLIKAFFNANPQHLAKLQEESVRLEHAG